MRNLRNSGFLLQCIAGVAASLWLTGCATSGYKKADTVADGMQTAGRDIVVESQALNTAVEKLNDLVEHPATDLKPQFKSFSKSMDILIASADRADRSGKHMQQQSAAYLKTWDEQIASMKYEVIRKQSTRRRNEVSGQVEAVYQRHKETQDVVRPVITYLTDIRKALSADLTEGGLESVKEIVRNAQENNEKVQKALTQLTGDLGTTRDRVSSIVVTDENSKAEVDRKQAEAKQAEAARTDAKRN